MVGDICRRYDMAFFDGLGRGRVVGFLKKKKLKCGERSEQVSLAVPFLLSAP